MGPPRGAARGGAWGVLAAGLSECLEGPTACRARDIGALLLLLTQSSRYLLIVFRLPFLQLLLIIAVLLQLLHRDRTQPSNTPAVAGDCHSAGSCQCGTPNHVLLVGEAVPYGLLCAVCRPAARWELYHN